MANRWGLIGICFFLIAGSAEAVNQSDENGSEEAAVSSNIFEAGMGASSATQSTIIIENSFEWNDEGGYCELICIRNGETFRYTVPDSYCNH